MPQQTFEAPADRGVLAGSVVGDGPPVLVLHGGPGLSVAIVDGLVADLAPAYRVATFQQRGIEPSTTEGRMRRKKPDYEAYVARTSGFIPLPPKKAA